jgi:tetratricopeptide (TPR) repeat protein
MIKWARIVTIIVALAFLGAGVFVLDAGKELNLAYRAYKHRDMDQAMRHARRANYSSRNDKKIIKSALKLEYAIAIKLGHPEKAMDYLGQAIQNEPSCGLCYLQRGDLEYKRTNYAAALDDFKKGFENTGPLKPEVKAYYYARQGLSHLALGETEKAQEDSQNALQSDPESPLAFFLLSKVKDKLGDHEGAYGNASKAYRLGQKKTGFFSSPEGDLWLRYYGDVMIHYKSAQR